jgi:hypothetical protein
MFLSCTKLHRSEPLQYFSDKFKYQTGFLHISRSISVITYRHVQLIPVLCHLKQHFRVNTTSLCCMFHSEARMFQHEVTLLLALQPTARCKPRHLHGSKDSCSGITGLQNQVCYVRINVSEEFQRQ